MTLDEITKRLGAEEREVLALISSGSIKARLHELVDQLSEPELLHLCAQRILIGQERYGLFRLKSDTRNWIAERLAEFVDAVVYDAAERFKQTL